MYVSPSAVYWIYLLPSFTGTHEPAVTTEEIQNNGQTCRYRPAAVFGGISQGFVKCCFIGPAGTLNTADPLRISTQINFSNLIIRKSLHSDVLIFESRGVKKENLKKENLIDFSAITVNHM